MENYDEEVQDVEVDDGKKRKIPLRSNVWAHFTKLPCGNKGKCHHCRKTFAANRGNTTNLKNHLDRCRSYEGVKVEGDPKQQVFFRQKGKDKDDGVVKLSAGFSQEACRMALVKMIVKDELPFSFVEAEGFLEFIQTCCPRFDVPSRRTITRDILELYQHEKRLLKSVLGASKQRVCITTDTWTSIQMSNYMVITAHFIDAEWVLHKRILSFTPIANHKGDGIGKLIETCLIDWGIERLFTITVDNASANKVAITYVKKKLVNWSMNSMILNGLYMHVRCSAHIINLIVQDGLAEVNNSIASIRNAVKYVRSSPARLQKFKTCVDREKISYGGLMVLDVPTRWNSTYLMLHKAVVFEKAFDRMKEDDGHYFNWFVEEEGEKKREGPPSDDDWGNAKRSQGKASGMIHSVDIHPSRKHTCLAGGSSGTVFAWDLRWQQQSIVLSGVGTGEAVTHSLSESEVWEVQYDCHTKSSNISSSRVLPAMFCSEDGILAVVEQGEEPFELLAEPCAINSFDIDPQNPSDVICSLEWESIAIVSRP